MKHYDTCTQPLGLLSQPFLQLVFILITLKHGLSRIIKRMGRLILTAFIFHLTQPGGMFEGCVCICTHDEYHAIECLETLEA